MTAYVIPSVRIGRWLQKKRVYPTLETRFFKLIIKVSALVSELRKEKVVFYLAISKKI